MEFSSIKQMLEGGDPGETSRDNRHLTNSSCNQKMTKEEIQALRKQGVSGQVTMALSINVPSTYILSEFPLYYDHHSLTQLAQHSVFRPITWWPPLTPYGPCHRVAP